MIEEHGRGPASQSSRSCQIRWDVLDAVEVEVPGFEDVTVALFLGALFSANRPLPIGQVAEQRVELSAPGLRRLGSASHRSPFHPFLPLRVNVLRPEHADRRERGQAGERQNVTSTEMLVRHGRRIHIFVCHDGGSGVRGEDLTTEEQSREQWETRGGCHGLGPDESGAGSLPLTACTARSAVVDSERIRIASAP